MFGIIDADGNVSQISGVESAYTGDKWIGELDTMKTYGADPNVFIQGTFEKLVQRQVALYILNPIASAVINKPLDYSIGGGLVFRSAINGEVAGFSSPEKAARFSREFTRLLHLEKLDANYYEKQGLMVRESLITGDCLLHFLRDPGDGRPFDLVLEGGYDIDSGKNKKREDKTRLILGVHVDKWKRRLGVVRKADPDEILPFVDDQGDRNFVMLLNQERAGQVRGYGRNFKTISMLKQTDRVWTATIERMVLEAIQVGYFQATDTDPKAQADYFKNKMKRASGTATSDDTSSGTPTLDPITKGQEVSPGVQYLLKNGENLKFTDLKTPSNNFDKANDWILKLAAMSSGYPPEFIKGEYSTSFTAHKGALNDAWKRILKERHTFSRIVDKVVNFEYLKYFIESGKIRVSAKVRSRILDEGDRYAIQDILSGHWLGPVPGQLDPMKEVNAYARAEELGYILKSDAAAQYGTDFENALDQWQAEETAFNQASAASRAEAIIKDQTGSDQVEETGSDQVDQTGSDQVDQDPGEVTE
jgi:capsid protein